MTGITKTDEKSAIEKILTITTAVSSSLEISEIFNIIVNKVAEAMDAIDCSIVLLEKDGAGARSGVGRRAAREADGGDDRDCQEKRQQRK